MLATQEEFLPPILIRSFYDFARRISFQDSTLYRCNVKLANCVIFFFFRKFTRNKHFFGMAIRFRPIVERKIHFDYEEQAIVSFDVPII